jgi:hypothetical protein
MLITLPDENEMEVVIKHHTCNFHKEHPEQRYPGCTCFSSYSQSYKKVDKEENTVYQYECVRMARKYIDGVWYDYDHENKEWTERE